MNVLVTGAHGFIGKNLCAALYNIASGKDKTRCFDSELKVFEYELAGNCEGQSLAQH